MNSWLLIEEITEAVNRKRTRPRKMSLRKERTWNRIDQVQDDIDEILDKLGKKETISVAKIVELNNRGRMPTLLKHAVVAITKYLLKKTNESRSQAFIGGHNIAFWSLRRYGYVKRNGYALTGKGVLRSKLHEREGAEGGRKTDRYGIMYNQVFKRKKSYSGKDKYRHKTEPKIRNVKK